MRRLTILSISLLSLSGLHAQTFSTFNTSQDIDINNIKAAHLVHGDMWWDPATSTNRCEYPKGSGKHVGFASSLWIGGYDGMGNLKVAAQTYRQNGNDYWPGPIDTASTLAGLYAYETDWAKIWKINRITIDSFLLLSTHTLANTPAAILSWPAIGNPYAAGNAGAALTINTQMAPFVDVNSDGTYNALNGDYPLIKGDQMLWWVINDAGVTHNLSQTSPMQLEIQNSSYAYQRGGMIDNMVFYEYKIINKGTQQLDSMAVGVAADMDLGDAFDDYVGFDSTRRMGIQYNGKAVDGNGQPNSYGANVPMAGVELLDLPGDNGTTLVPAGSFVSYDNDASANGNPVAGAQFFNLLHSRNRLGTPLSNGRRYAFGLSSECDSNHMPYDRRFVIASNSFSLNAGASLKIAMALVVSPNAGGCPTMNFTDLQSTADSALIVYRNPPPLFGVTSVASCHLLHIYPNPSDNMLYVEPGNTHMDGTIKIYDAIGRTMPFETKKTATRFEIVTSPLPAGMYTITYNTTEGPSAATFIKK